MLVELPNGYLRSKLHVKPANWKTIRASTKKPWYIQYRFYDPSAKGTPGYKKMVMVKGMNQFTKLRERQQATERILSSLAKLLDKQGYNPITEQMITPMDTVYIVDPQTGLCAALKQAAGMITASESVQRDLKSTLKFTEQAARQLRYENTPISHISRKHIYLVLQQIEKIRGTRSHHRYNKNRSYLMMLFKELMKVEAVDINPVLSVEKMTGVHKLRRVLTTDEIKRIDAHLKTNYYSFWRYMHIFFHSGARLTELMRLQVKDVDIANQVFLLLVKKGRSSKEVLKPIKDIALDLWKELLANNPPPDAYVFSKGLIPGEQPIRSYQITKRMYRLVKDDNKLGIKADFYSLKHLNLDQTATILSIDDAAAMASHTTTAITMKHYATGEQLRQMDKLRKVNNPLI